MAVQTINVGGKRFVLLPEKEYLALRSPAEATGSKRPQKATSRPRGSTKQDRGDVAESKRRLAEGAAKPYARLRKELGLS